MQKRDAVQHTPEPWRSNGAGGEIHGNSRVIATMAWCSGMQAEDEANARLVAAAPEMLAALQEIIECDADSDFGDGLCDGDDAGIADGGGLESPRPFMSDKLSAAIGAAMAAVIKATGTPITRA